MTSLHLHRFGPERAPAVLALHGVTGEGGVFGRLAQEALPERRVLAPDLRGHGRSPWTPPWGLEQHVDDLLAVLDDEGIERTTLVGHSFGGLVALALAAAAPARLSSLVLLDPAVAVPPETALEVAEAVRLDAGWASRDEALAELLEGRPEHARAAVEGFVDRHLAEQDGRVRARFAVPAAVAAWGEMARPQVTLPRPIPTLLVWARQADFVTLAVLERLRADLGPALSEVALDAGHDLLWEAFDETAAAVRAFVDATRA